jgi:hypothetical protein
LSQPAPAIVSPHRNTDFSDPGTTTSAGILIRPRLDVQQSRPI